MTQNLQEKHHSAFTEGIPLSMPLYGFFLLLALPVVSGWNWPTHEALVTSIALSHEGTELNISLLRIGAIVPDKYFHDFIHHSLPSSEEEARKWLAHAKEALGKGDVDEASFSFGVASHYLSDSFSSPHSIAGEEYEAHSAYETQAEKAGFSVVPCDAREDGWSTLLQDGKKNGLAWTGWMKTRDEKIPIKHVAASVNTLHAAFDFVFDQGCRTPTEIQRGALAPVTMEALFLLGLIILACALLLGKELLKEAH